jgi:hypothetical protein
VKTIKDNTEYVDFTQKFLDLQEEHKYVFIYKFDDLLFIYRPLGRSEYRNLTESEDYNNFQKEEIMCEACTLWPENFDFENCQYASLPSKMAIEILKNSFLDSNDARKNITMYFRKEMLETENQITCIINEAFPQFDIEEIEQWGIAKTAKYLSRAEWKLKNLRGAPILDTSDFMAMEQAAQQQQEQQASQAEEPQEVDDDPLKHGKIETIQERQARLSKKGNKKTKLTPQELAELRAKYPEMQWGNNVTEELTMDNFGKDVVDSTPVALRTGW